MPPQVTIIINCYNEVHDVRNALDSAFAQTYTDWEIVFWDNASTDGSGDLAKSYGDKVRYFRSGTNVRLGHARSLAFEQARGKYIAILDSDDTWQPQKLKLQVEQLESDPQLAITFCDCICFDDVGDRYRLFNLAKPHRGWIFGDLLSANFIFSSAAMFRKEALDSLDYIYDERYFKAPDVDLLWNLAYRFPIDYIDEPLTRIRITQRDHKWWQKPLVPAAVEIKEVMDNIVNKYPEIRSKYEGELKGFYRQIDYSRAMTEWENSSPAKARGYLSQHLSHKPSAILYLLTVLMSYNFFNRLKRVYRTRIARRQ